MMRKVSEIVIERLIHQEFQDSAILGTKRECTCERLALWHGHSCLCGFRQAQQPPGDPGPGEVQVRVDAVGLCGSDVHSYAEGGIGDTPCQYPMVLGHEPAGTVVATGAGVTGWSPGDRAALEPAVYCY